MYTKENHISLFISIYYLFFLLAGCILFPGFSVSAADTDIEEDYLTYTENEDGSLTVTGYDRTKHTEPYILTISNSYSGKPVTAIDDRLFKGYSFESISIDNNIAIGAHAFENTSVSTVSIGTDSSGSNLIGKYAFAQTRIETQISISSQVTYDDYCFKFAYFGDEQVHQPDPVVTHIGSGAFENSNYRSGINCEALLSIGEGAFRRSNLREFMLSPTIQSIGTEAFSFPVQTSSEPVFSDIYIDAQVDSIEGFHLEDMTNTFFHVDANSPVLDYLSSHNMNFFLMNDDKDNTTPAYIGQILQDNGCTVRINGEHTATLLAITFDEEVLTLDQQYDISYHGHTYSINTLAESSLDGRNCPYVKKLILGDNITRIESFCFTAMNPVPVEEIVLSNNIEVIESSGIPNQDPLTLTFPSGITSLDNLHITNLDSVIFQIDKDCPFIHILIENRLTYQFLGENPVDPEDPTYSDPIHSSEGSDDSGNSEGSGDSDNSDAPNDSDNSGSSDSPGNSNNSDSSGDSNASDNSGDSSTSGNNNDSGSSDASGKTESPQNPIPPNVQNYPKDSSAESQLPESKPIVIGKKIYQITGKNTVTFIKPTDKTLRKLIIPAYITFQGTRYKVTKIENKACYQCSRLQTITIGSNVTTIGDNAFAKCSRLKKITFGKNVKKLGKRVLYYDQKLTDIKFRGTRLNYIGKQTFRNVPKTVSIIVPNSRVSKYKRLINNAK